MRTIYRDPQVEEYRHTIVLQNRCGNRLSVLVDDDHTDLELTYKPNAFRRKELRARNFSNRDNFTTLFKESGLPEIGAQIITEFDYDPFLSRLQVETPSGARNAITLLNVIDENCFVVTADRPLTLAFRPHAAFEVDDGLLYEAFSDRGEEIVAFVAFESFEENRFRVLDDGRAIIQLFEDEIVLIGGEENLGQVNRVLRTLSGMALEDMRQYNETRISHVTRAATVHTQDDELQQVIDLNKRLVHSGLDEGGACFGALNRIYHLIWVRDGSMSTALMARAGLPSFTRIWTPFLLANPTVRRKPDGECVPEFLQILGTRWTKSEDDGPFYAALSAYALYETTGDSRFMDDDSFDALMLALDDHIATRFSQEEMLFGSDTLGETTLAGSPYFGYDLVNGTMPRHLSEAEEEGRPIQRVFSLYHNVNIYNALRMTATLLSVRGGDDERVCLYTEMADRLRETLATKFVNDEGVYHAYYAYYKDGTRAWTEFPKSDYWEYAWAVSVGPFHPDTATALRSARMVREIWPTVKAYGYCPWNTLSRMLREYGMDSATYRAMLTQQIDEALQETEKYPMHGALTEYQGKAEGWRGLPFSTGSFMWSVHGLLLQSLPAGLAVRASDLVDAIDDYRFRTARIDVSATGSGDVVRAWRLNGEAVEGTLQIPLSKLRTGRNEIVVERGEEDENIRLVSSSAELLEVNATDGGYVYRLWSPVPCEMVFEGYAGIESLVVRGEDGSEIEVEAIGIEDTEKTEVRVKARGGFIAELRV